MGHFCLAVIMGQCCLVVAGGSVAKYLCSGLPFLSSDWSKWRVFLCDERYVPQDHLDCTYGIYRSSLASNIPDLVDNIFPIMVDDRLSGRQSTKYLYYICYYIIYYYFR